MTTSNTFKEIFWKGMHLKINNISKYDSVKDNNLDLIIYSHNSEKNKNKNIQTYISHLNYKIFNIY